VDAEGEIHDVPWREHVIRLSQVRSPCGRCLTVAHTGESIVSIEKPRRISHHTPHHLIWYNADTLVFQDCMLHEDEMTPRKIHCCSRWKRISWFDETSVTKKCKLKTWQSQPDCVLRVERELREMTLAYQPNHSCVSTDFTVISLKQLLKDHRSTLKICRWTQWSTCVPLSQLVGLIFFVVFVFCLLTEWVLQTSYRKKL